MGGSGWGGWAAGGGLSPLLELFGGHLESVECNVGMEWWKGITK